MAVGLQCSGNWLAARRGAATNVPRSQPITAALRFFALANFWGRALQKLYPVYQSRLAARRLKKFCEDTPSSPEVIEGNTLNFRPNFKFSRLKFFWGTPVPLGGVH